MGGARTIRPLARRPLATGVFGIGWTSMKPGLLALATAALGACANAPPPAPASAPVAAVLSTPDVDLRDAKGARVGSQAVPMDGVAEGLAWPALRLAVNRKPGDHAPLTIAVSRDVPLGTVLRAVWTLRDADLRLQTPDVGGTPRVLPLHPSPEPASPGCHLAVFVATNGDLRVAYPGGPRSIPSPDAAGALAQALNVERMRCPIRFVAFGAESADAPWSAPVDQPHTTRIAGPARTHTSRAWRTSPSIT
jgi:hypothetical protein